jgi:hypothetical protein
MNGLDKASPQPSVSLRLPYLAFACLPLLKESWDVEANPDALA